MTYRAGIIGAGGIAGLGILGMHANENIGTKRFEASHAGGYEAVADIDLVAIADIDAEKLDQFGSAWGIPPERRYLGHEAMLAAENLDVISVCSPSYLHRQHVVDAATSTANPSVIWCEKPIASNVTDANEMCEVCTETDTELLINHALRFTDKLQRLRTHIQDGLVGDVKAVSTHFRRELLRASTHQIDTLVYLLDVRASMVSGYVNGENDSSHLLGTGTEVDDAGGGGLVVMDDGTFAMIDCTLERSMSSMSFELLGTEGRLYLNNDDGEWRYWDLNDGDHVETTIPGIDGAWTWDDDYQRAFATAAEHAVNLVEGRVENHSTGEDATRSLEIIIGFFISHYTGSHVSIPLDRPLRDVTVTSW